MRQVLLSFLFVLAYSFAWAQNTTVTGQITDGDTGEGLPGVNIVVKGTITGSTTDLEGNYSISVPGDATLVVSYVGYGSQEIAVGARTVIDVAMSPDVSQLSEVVVIGYGETTVRDATGAVSAITAKDFNGGIISSPEQLFQGKTAGVQMTSTSGAPGAGVELRIRGTNSVRANNNPLFVVDGVPLAGDETTAATPNVGFGTNGASNPLNFLDPNDIESVSILKDASSAAIYGSRGANGVVFITTKRGKGPGTWDFASSTSIATPANKYDLLKVSEGPYFLSGIGQFGGDAQAQDFGSDTDWQDFITRTAVSNKQNLSFSKASEALSFRASLGYEDQQGIIENSAQERITARFNGNKSFLNDDLNIALQSTFSKVNLESAPVGGSAGFRGDLLGAAYSANPTWPADPTFDTGGQLNPANMLANFRSTSNTSRMLINLTADYKIMENLSAKFTYGLDRSKGETVGLSTPEARNFDRGTEGNGRGGYNETKVANNLVELSLTYNKSFGNSRIEAVAGYSFQDFGRKGLNAEGYGFTNYTSGNFSGMESDFVNAINAIESAAAAASGGGFYQQFGLGNDLRGGAETSGGFVSLLTPNVATNFFSAPSVNVSTITGDRFDFTDKLQSYFARVNYSIADKYLFTATIRADGSSRFGTKNRTGVFPSAAFAWQLGEEAFMPDFISTLKLRTGYGVVGNQDGLGYGNFVRRERYSKIEIGDGGEINIPGTSAVSLPEDELKWEETTQFSIGADFGFGSDRLTGSFDYYRKETTDLILRLNAAQPAPNPFVFRNFDAVVVNKGWELGLNYDIFNSTNSSFSASFNISRNDNEIQDFGGQVPAGTIRGQGLSQAFSQILAQGQPLFSFFVREFAGFDGNGQPIRDNQTFVGKSALPTWNTGLSLNFTSGNWDISAYMTGQFGHYIYNNTRNAFFTAGAIANGRNVTVDVLTSGESGAAEAAVSERFLEKGDFIRMQNLTVGYTVPISNSGLFKRLRFYANAQNLFLITDYTGLDPEVSSQAAQVDLLNELPTAGIDYTSYVRPRVFTIGLNASF